MPDEGGFLAKLMAMFGGGGAPAPSPSPSPAGAPWETSPGAPAPPGFHRMPDGALMQGPPMGGPGGPPGAPQGPQDDIGAQVQKLMKQREIMKLLSPEKAWNTPQQ
jgi:hypothetical protein